MEHVLYRKDCSSKRSKQLHAKDFAAIDQCQQAFIVEEQVSDSCRNLERSK